MNNLLTPLYHRYGDFPCGKVAMYTVGRLIKHIDTLDAWKFVRLDGTHPIDGVDEILCGHCLRPVYPGIDVVYEDE
jgi:hypothetical protein